MVVHPGLKTSVTVLVKRIGGHGQDRNVRPARQRTNRDRCQQTIHHRHLDIHQDQIIRRLAGHLDGDLSVFGHVHPHTDGLQHLACHFLIDIVVLYQKNACSATFFQFHFDFFGKSRRRK